MKDKIEFTVDGEKYYVLKPTQEQTAQAEFVYKTKYSEALRYGALTHHEAQRIIEERSLFTEEDSKESTALLIKATNLGHKLQKTDSASDGLDIIQDIDNTRKEILILNRKRNAILDNTSESYADEQRLHYYIVSTTFKSNGEKAFANSENLISRGNDPIAVKATKYVIYMIANDGEDFRTDWPDYQWRIKNGLVDSEMEPVKELPKAFKDKLESEKNPAIIKKKSSKKKASKKKATSRK